MKKFFFFAALAAMTLTACNDVNKIADEADSKFEIGLVNAADMASKGYVAGATMEDNLYNALHYGDEGLVDSHSWRDIRLSAYLTPGTNQIFASQPYFIDEIWRTDAAGAAASWKHYDAEAAQFVPVYWPMSGNLQFLGISMTEPLTGSAVAWNSQNPAAGVTLTIGDKFMQDDVMYADCASRGSNEGAAVAMNFRHTQAWIEFAIQASTSDIVTIKDIVIENIYTRGDVTVGPVVSPATENVIWNFDREASRNVSMPDNYAGDAVKQGYEKLLKVSAPAAATDIKYFDVLIPKQSKTAFLVYYTLAGQDNVLEFRYALDAGTWNAGSKYVYEITFKPHEIVVDPTVTTFAGGTVTDFTPTTHE